jgi:uncharacterized protein
VLVEFRAKNFRSLRNDQTLSFVASSDKLHRVSNCIETGHPGAPCLTRAAVMYGANASGKSNLLFALATMREMVLRSTTQPSLAEPYTPFRLDTVSAREPVEFEITLLIEGVRYQYGFAFDAARIRHEWLLVYKTSKAQRWFERRYDPTQQQDDWQPFSAYFTGERETWKRATRPQALFLSTAFQLNSALLRPLYDWFGSGIISLPTLAPLNLLPTLEKLDDPAYKARILKLLGAADIHIADIKVSRMPGHQFEMKLKAGKVPELKTWQGEFPDVEFCHQLEGGEPVWFDRRYESFGTQRLLGYAGPLLDAIENGRLLVVDEFDTSLHSLLTRYLLGLIQSPELSCKGAQLLMTTHDTTLLDPEILRRDQVWFVEKKPREQESVVYPLTDFSPRKNEALERGYLMGRYGALPYLSDFRF